MPPVRIGRPVVTGWNALAPGAIRLTMIRLGSPVSPLMAVRPPYHRLPAASAADIGSQHIPPVSLVAVPGASIVFGTDALVKFVPPLLVTQPLMPPPPLTPTMNR